MDKERPCDHSGKKKTVLTKSGVYVVCLNCKKRKKVSSKIVIEKVAEPGLIPIAWMEEN